MRTCSKEDLLGQLSSVGYELEMFQLLWYGQKVGYGAVCTVNGQCALASRVVGFLWHTTSWKHLLNGLTILRRIADKSEAARPYQYFHDWHPAPTEVTHEQDQSGSYKNALDFGTVNARQCWRTMTKWNIECSFVQGNIPDTWKRISISQTVPTWPSCLGKSHYWIKHDNWEERIKEWEKIKTLYKIYDGKSEMTWN